MYIHQPRTSSSYLPPIASSLALDDKAAKNYKTKAFYTIESAIKLYGYRIVLRWGFTKCQGHVNNSGGLPDDES